MTVQVKKKNFLQKRKQANFCLKRVEEHFVRCVNCTTHGHNSKDCPKESSFSLSLFRFAWKGVRSESFSLFVKEVRNIYGD